MRTKYLYTFKIPALKAVRKCTHRTIFGMFPDPETILAEEAYKKPCNRFASGQCQFGGICRYSHYTRQEIDTLREYGKFYVLFLPF